MTQPRGRDERGAISVWVISALLGFLLAVGIGVDLVGHARAEQLARSIAAEAARAGAQQVRVSDGTLRLDTERARAAAKSYLASSPYEAQVVVTDTVVTTTARGEYRCLFLNLIGVTTLSVTGVGTAHAMASG